MRFPPRPSRTGQVAIEVYAAVSTNLGVEPGAGLAARIETDRYLGRSGVERYIVEAWERFACKGCRDPPLIIIDSPPGTGKTMLLLKLMEAARRSGRLLGYWAGTVFYLAPYKAILDEIRERYARVAPDYDPSRREHQYFYLLYRSPEDCPVARKYRDYIERYGAPSIACKVCPYRSRVTLQSRKVDVSRVLIRAAISEGRATDAPIIEVLPRREGETCLRSIAVQSFIMLPRLASLRRQRIAGIMAAYNALLNPTFLNAWEGIEPRDTAKTIIVDEFDMLITNPVAIDDVFPYDLYPKEKEVLHKTIGVRNYQRALEILAEAGDPDKHMWPDEAARVLAELVQMPWDRVEEACRLCERAVIEEGEYCRICNRLRTLAIIAGFIKRQLERGCHPLADNYIELGRPECLRNALSISSETLSDSIRISARPIFAMAEFLLNPYYPSTSIKILASATSDIILNTGGIIERIVSGVNPVVYGPAVVARAAARYNYLIVRVWDGLTGLNTVVKTIASTGNALLDLLLGVHGGRQGYEYAVLTGACSDACLVLSDAVELIGDGECSIIFANSKANADIEARMICDYMTRRLGSCFSRRTSDYIELVGPGGRTVYVTWHRSRVSRGVSQFRSCKAAVLVWRQSDPVTERTLIHTYTRQIYATVQALFRIIRGIVVGPKYFVMPSNIWAELEWYGPRWLRDAPARVERVYPSQSQHAERIKTCTEICSSLFKTKG